MTVVVQKFGGSSLGDLEKLGSVADLVVRTRAAGEQPVVVVSAMGKTTEGLLELARQVSARTESRAPAELPRRELDMLVTTGERVSMALLSIAIQARGVPAISFTGSQAGILTSPEHFDARIRDIRPGRVQAALQANQVVIVAGYQGVSAHREITTLGRGGSDTTAVALAAALGAQRCEIYSDVDGVYTADPHQVDGARHLAAIDYGTLHEMAEAGARVLNARAVAWGRDHQVRIHARRTDDFARGGGGRETVISDCPQIRTAAVVTNPKLAVLAAAPSSVDELLAAASTAGLFVRDVLDQGTRVTATVPLTSVPDFPAARRALERRGVPELEISEDYAELNAVGPGEQLNALAAQALRALPSTPLLSLRSGLRLSVLVRRAELAASERAWHRLFVEAA